MLTYKYVSEVNNKLCLLGASHTVATQVGELSRITHSRWITTSDTFAVVLRAFVKGSPPFLREGFEMFKTFVVDEPLIYIMQRNLTMAANYTFFMIRRLSRDSVTGSLHGVLAQ